MAEREKEPIAVQPDTNAASSGTNGKGGPPPALGVDTPAENLLERSLEEFIARANTLPVEVDGWPLEPEKPAAPAAVAPPAASEPVVAAPAVATPAAEAPAVAA